MTDAGQNPTLTRLSELEGRVDRLEQKEREMSEINIATTEHERNTVVERGETLSLHEQLREADKDREAGKYGVRYPFWATGDQLAAIQEAIEAPWRERVAELEEIAKAKWWLMIDELKAENAALKARADALRGESEQAKYILARSLPRSEFESAVHEAGRKLGAAVDAYDAADRAGETQDGNLVLDWSRITRSVDSVATDRQPDGLAAPIPTDAAAGLDAPAAVEIGWLRDRVTDLERWREDVDFHMTHIRKFRDSMVPALAKANLRILALEQRLDAMRGPEVTVTHEMCEAFWAGYKPADNDGLLAFDPEVTVRVWRGLEAVEALRAGGAKE